MKKFMSVTAMLMLVLSLTACGGSNSTVSQTSSSTAEETGIKDLETVMVGNKITTDFVELTIEEAGFANSLKTSIKTGNITRTFGPDDSAETDFAYIKGTITNKSTASISDEITAVANVGDYTLEEDGLYVYKSDGDTVWELSPLVEYNFIMCVEIPNTLIENMENCNFNFGFNENMESSFSEFKELEYKYSLEITPESEAPAPQTATE